MFLAKIRTREIIKNLILIAISIVIPVLVIEFALHFTQFRNQLKREIYPKDYFVADNELGYVIAKNVATTTHYFADGKYPIWSNSLGCFDIEHEEGKYIYLTGDSFAWGFTPFKDKWGTIMEKGLEFPVYKCGVGGYGTKQELIKTERDTKDRPKPELIVLSYLSGNDIEDDSNFPNYSVYQGYLVNNLYKDLTKEKAQKTYKNLYSYCTKDPQNKLIQGMKCWFSNHSIIYNLSKDLGRKIVTKILPKSWNKSIGFIVEEKNKQYFEDNQKFENHLLNLLSFKVLADKYNSKLLVVILPGNNSRQIDFLKKMNIDFIDLDLEFAKYDKNFKKDLYWKKDGHWNPKGNQLAGYIVTKYILENEIIPIENSKEKLELLNEKIKDFTF